MTLFDQLRAKGGSRHLAHKVSLHGTHCADRGKYFICALRVRGSGSCVAKAMKHQGSKSPPFRSSAVHQENTQPSTSS